MPMKNRSNRSRNPNRSRDPKLSLGWGFAVYPNTDSTDPDRGKNEGPKFLAYIARQRAHPDGRLNLPKPSCTGSLVGPGIPEKMVGNADEILDFLDAYNVPQGVILASFKYDRAQHMIRLQIGSNSFIVSKTTRPAPGTVWIRKFIQAYGPKLGVPKREMSISMRKPQPYKRRKHRKRSGKKPKDQVVAEAQDQIDAREAAKEQPAEVPAPEAAVEQPSEEAVVPESEPAEAEPMSLKDKAAGLLRGKTSKQDIDAAVGEVVEAAKEASSTKANTKMSVAKLELSQGIVKALAEAEVTTAGRALKLLKTGDDAALAIEGFGPEGLKKLKAALKKHGFELP